MSKERCFIITPIGNKNDEIRRHIDGIINAVIKPVIEEKYEVVVSHEISEIGSINKQIIREIYDDKLVIANLTTINPNVMYELAFRHSVGKPVIVIAEEGTVLPFDISVERTIFYKNDALGTLELQEKLRDFIESIDFGTISGPIHEVIKEYNQENDFIKYYEVSENKENVDSLKYIINRLNSIEKALSNMEISSYRNSFPHQTETLIRFEDYNKKIKDEEIIQTIKKAEKIDSNYLITGVTIDRNQKTIIIREILKQPISVPSILNYYQRELSKLEFIGVYIDFCK